MSKKHFTVKAESDADLPVIEALCTRAFGPGRFARTAYRIRERGHPDAALSLTGWINGRLVGSIRFTPVLIGGMQGALLLGPLVVDPDCAGQGFGRQLVARGLDRARKARYRLVLLVGDLPYYRKSGFCAVPRGQIRLPGPVDPARLLAAEIEEDALASFAGMLEPR